MNLQSYLDDAEKVYHYRIKTVVTVDDATMERIERSIHKYHPISIGKVQKTIIQNQPLDFPTLTASEVFILDIELSIPVSPSVLQQDIRTSLGCAEKYVVVRGDNDPLENETERLFADSDIDAIAKKDGLVKKALLTMNNYEEHETPKQEELCGAEYTNSLLDYLRDVQLSRKESKIDAPSSLFKWMDLPKSDVEASDYNADIKDAPKAASMRSPGSLNGLVGSFAGNLDDDKKTYRRVYTDKNGKDEVLSRKSNSIRKD